MKTIKAALLIVSIAIILLLSVTLAKADREAAPFDYAIITEDKKFIFIMLVPDEEIRQAWDILGEEPSFYETRVFDSEISFDQWNDSLRKHFSLRKKYPCSGLYKNDGSITPLWTVSWYGDVYLLPDGEHLIRKGPWNKKESRSTFAGLAVAFYKNGFEVAKYSVDDLVKDTSAIQFSVSHYQWEDEERFDRETGLLFIRTLDHQKYTFDIRRMAESVQERNVECQPNYRFVPPIEASDIQTLAFSIITFLIVIGSARFVDVIQENRHTEFTALHK